MYTKDNIPLTINTKANFHAQAGIFSAAFQYTEEPSLRKAANIDQSNTQQYGITTGASSRRRAQSTGMNGQPSTAAPAGMYVRALYDYESDDRTSLSFRQVSRMRHFAASFPWLSLSYALTAQRRPKIGNAD